jgi:hypothetical protein
VYPFLSAPCPAVAKQFVLRSHYVRGQSQVSMGFGNLAHIILVLSLFRLSWCPRRRRRPHPSLIQYHSAGVDLKHACADSYVRHPGCMLINCNKLMRYSGDKLWFSKSLAQGTLSFRMLADYVPSASGPFLTLHSYPLTITSMCQTIHSSLGKILGLVGKWSVCSVDLYVSEPLSAFKGCESTTVISCPLSPIF